MHYQLVCLHSPLPLVCQTLPLTNVAHCHNWSPSLGLADSQPARCEGLSMASIIRQKHKPQPTGSQKCGLHGDIHRDP
ncbi:hypothetical protein ILYODFUR_030868 [Ilyodon furcidens]|uniref:Uncharacterized protein n=1 Tax=Ilyodon furcidens TaxID=33524 RepID=A0ABV0U1W7_9TELE